MRFSFVLGALCLMSIGGAAFAAHADEPADQCNKIDYLPNRVCHSIVDGLERQTERVPATVRPQVERVVKQARDSCGPCGPDSSSSGGRGTARAAR